MAIEHELVWKDSGALTKQRFDFNAGTDLLLRFTKSGSGSIAGKTLQFVMAETTESAPVLLKVDADISKDGDDTAELSIDAIENFEFRDEIYYWELRQVDVGSNHVLAYGNGNCTANPEASGDGPDPVELPISWDDIANLPSTLAGFGITDGVSAEDLAAYQPLDSDLTAIAALTSTSFGRGILEVANQAAARTYIGAGTSSFDGAYSSLSGVPSSFTPSTHATSHKHGGSDEIATSTPAANAIPKAGSGGALAAGWIPSLTASQISDFDTQVRTSRLGSV